MRPVGETVAPVPAGSPTVEDLEAEQELAAAAATLSTAPREQNGADGALRPAKRGRLVDRRSPGIAGVIPTVRRLWRQLTSMRTALLLLSLLALAAVPGSILPQRGVNDTMVSEYLRRHPSLGPLLDRFSLFDVFAAPWFAAIYLLLFTSLVGCLVPRLRRQARALLAAPPPAPRHLHRLPASSRWATGARPDVGAIGVAELLRRQRWRVAIRAEEPGPLVAGTVHVAAEKGFLRESGNLLFHLGLLALLVGVAMGGLFGYKGNVLVQQGDTFTNTRSSYDSFRPGRLFQDGQLAPFAFTLTKFRATYQPTGMPRSFDAQLSWQRGPTAPIQPVDVQVNHPLLADGAKVYLIGHGYAPHFVVRDGHRQVAFDGYVPFLPQDANFTSTGVIKVPDAAPDQLGFSGFFLPTTVAGPGGLTSAFPAVRNPSVVLLAYRGDLGLSSGISQSVYELDTSRLRRVATGLLAQGQTMALPGGGSITFEGYREFATFQVTSDPGKLVALTAAVLILTGLLLSLRVRRRRLWVRLSAASGGTAVEVGGLARNDPDEFTAEFDRLLERFRQPLPVLDSGAAPPGGAGPTSHPAPAVEA